METTLSAFFYFKKPTNKICHATQNATHMKALPNGCRMGKITKLPTNWEDGGKNTLAATWKIMFWFYNFDGRRLKVIIRNFNTIESLEDRRKNFKIELKEIEHRYEKLGWNPILKEYSVAPPKKETDEGEPGPDMPFIKALWYAHSVLKKAKSTMSDLKTYIQYIENTDATLNEKPFSEVRKKDLKILFEKAAHLKKDGEFSPDKYNRLRTYMGIVYSELMEYEIAEVNIPLSLKVKKDTVKKIRATLTDDQRRAVDKYLFEHYLGMWVYMHCFFHSGARNTEMFTLKGKDVDFQKQEIKYLVKKGGQYREVIRVMPDVAVKYWQAACWDCPKDYYIFSKLRRPGAMPVQSFQNHKSWRRHIKIALGIDADFYGLKHMKTTEISNELGTKQAAKQAGESEAMIQKVYDLDNKKRKDNDLKSAGSEFA